MVFENYNSGKFYDELFDENNKARQSALPLVWGLSHLKLSELRKKQEVAETLLMQMGVTFTVYGDKRSTEKIMPFDIIPRIIPASEFDYIEKGLKQRIHALNLFLSDCYGEKKIFKDKIIPEDLIFKSEFYIPQLDGFRPPKDVWVHISGIDL
ncbi:MAG: circularly permuted type 2 ATP-grasp protein, partial [Rickettsiales bacterium]|nr:circularly permuted type 2 ATP-grasp protein [Rickettsiales bacterium]